MRRRMMIAAMTALGILWAGLVTGAQSGEVAFWALPVPDRLPNDLAIASDGTVYVSLFLGESIGVLDPDAGTLVEWPIDGSPGWLLLTDLGLFYTLPDLAAVGHLDFTAASTELWRVITEGSWPTHLLAANYGSGAVNLYLSERTAGKLAAFEPVSIEAPLSPTVPNDPVLLEPTVSQRRDATQTASATVIRATGQPGVTSSIPAEAPPFREWSPVTQGSDAYVDGLAFGGDGGIWYCQGLAPYLYVLVPWDNLIAAFSLPEGTSPVAVSAGPDESIWFADVGQSVRIGRLEPDAGDVEMWDVPHGTQPYAFAFDEAGDVWFSDREADAIYRFDPETGTFTWWTLPKLTHPLSIVPGEAGTFWFVSEQLNAVGRLRLTGD